MKTTAKDLLVVGWREWISLPALGIPVIKAKVDTGARTSALHAFSLNSFKENGKDKIRFLIHPYQRKKKPVIECITELKEMRWVTDSGGHREERPVIETLFRIGNYEWPIEITLTSRDDMRFRMLLGRTAMVKRVLVNPMTSYLIGKKIKL
jgi:hypothetical protein